MGALNSNTTLSTVQRFGAMALMSMSEHRYRNPRPASPPYGPMARSNSVIAQAAVNPHVSPSFDRLFPLRPPATLGFFGPWRFAPEVLEHPVGRYDLRPSKCPQRK